MKTFTRIFLSLLVCTFFLTGCTPADVVPFLNHMTDSVSGWMGFSAIVGGVLDILVRLFPSVNPTSILLVVSEGLHAVARLTTALSEFLDKVGLQNAQNKKSF